MKQKIAILFLFLITANQLMAQCAMCKAIAEDQEVAALSSLNTGIIYITTMINITIHTHTVINAVHIMFQFKL